MKSLRVLVASLVSALTLAACGSGSVQSPDFTPKLTALTVTTDAAAETQPGTGAQYMSPIGRPAKLSAIGTYTTPPGSASATMMHGTDAEYTLSPANVARVDGDSLIGLQTGNVTVTATKKDITSAGIVIRITPAELDSIAVSPSAATISEFGGAQTFSATGTYSDGTTKPLNVNWAAQDPGLVAFSPNPGAQTSVSALPGSAGNSTVISATSVDFPGITPGTATITINNVTLTAINSVACTPTSIGVGETATCVANATYSDGSTGPVANSALTWSSTAAATIDANGMATGVTGGSTATITATLNSDNTKTASTTLTITDPRCTGPFLSSQGDVTVPAATTQSTLGTGDATFSQTCLICAVTNPGNVIDGDINTFGSLSVTLGLLNPTVTLTASGATVYPAGGFPGFVVAQPAGMLLSAELLSTLTVTTLLNGTVQESFSQAQQTSPIPGVPLNVTLLGTIGGQDAALVTFPQTATKTYNQLALTFDGGVVSALPSLNVFQACGTSSPDALP